MDYKYIHAAFKQFDEYFKRSFNFVGSNIRSTYGFASDIPYIRNRVIVDWDHCVFNYEALLAVDDPSQIDAVEIPSVKLTSLNIEAFDNIIRKNIAVAAHMKELEKISEVLKELEAL